MLLIAIMLRQRLALPELSPCLMAFADAYAGATLFSPWLR